MDKVYDQKVYHQMSPATSLMPVLLPHHHRIISSKLR
jgi:hypothetical protein